MKFPLSLLATTLALTSLSSHALTQAELDNTAKTLNLNVALLENKPADCPAESPWGFCYRIEIQLKNNGKKALDKDVDIYFSSIHRSLKSHNEEFSVTHVNGDLHRISATDKFKGLAPGKTASLKIDFQNWIVSDTDFMPNYYVASEGLEARVIANTVPVLLNGEEDISGYTPGIQNTPNQLKRNDGDTIPTATAATRFEDNSIISNLGSDAVKAKILPTPKEIKVLEGELNIAQGINIVAAENSLPAAQQAVLNERLQQLGIKTGAGVELNVAVKEDKKATSGSYTLNVSSDGIEVVGADAAGAFYGVQSVMSLITLGKDTIPNLEVEDSPRYDYRGMHMDVSRNFHSKALVFKLLDQMAAYKLNKFHFHLGDDEGWRLEIPGLPELTEVGSNRCHDLTETTCLLPQLGSGPDTSTNGSGYYTTEDYKEILAYASARNIQVIPSMDMPGHSRAAIRSMDARYRKFMEQGDQKAAEMYLLSDKYDETKYFSIQHYTDNTINPCMESSFVFMDKVIDEIKKVHAAGGQPLTDYHIGADETAGAWGDSPACRELFVDPDNGIGSTKDLSEYFINRISHILDNHGLSLAAWNDGLNHDGIMPPETLAGDTSAYVWGNLFWGGAGTYDAFATAGYDVVVALPDVVYFDMPYESDPKERGYYWATRYTNSQKIFNFMPDNIPANAEIITDRMGGPLNVTSDVKKNEFKGMQGHIWSETIRQDDQVEYMVFPRVLALAERAWHVAEWEPKHKKGVNYQTTGFGHEGTNHLGKYLAQRDAEWAEFANVVGHKELAKLDAANVIYRIPVPGAVIKEGKLEANITFPGLTIEYSTDGTNWMKYDVNNKPSVAAGVLVRSVSSNDRPGRAVEVK